MNWNLTTILSVVSLAFGVLVFLISLAGVFWPPTPLSDVGLLTTTVTFVLFGAVGLLLARNQAPKPLA